MAEVLDLELDFENHPTLFGQELLGTMTIAQTVEIQ
jgi:hypothetical protein